MTSLRSGIAALAATVPKRSPALTYFHELDNTPYAVSARTYVRQIYALAGVNDIADPANAKGTAYPPVVRRVPAQGRPKPDLPG